ncbi:MAG: hypothetical protein ABI411_02860 [Tahibacter sp.]
MMTMRLLGTALTAHASESAPAKTGVVEKCGVVTVGDDGQSSSDVLPSLKVVELTADDKAFVLPPDAPARVTAVTCGRASIVPAENDYKVLLAGFPFSIIADDRILWLELDNGQLQVSVKEGQLSPK